MKQIVEIFGVENGSSIWYVSRIGDAAREGGESGTYLYVWDRPTSLGAEITPAE